MIFRLTLGIVLLFGLAGALHAQPQASDEAPLYYVITRGATVYSRADSSQPYVQLKFREPVYLLEQKGRWCEIKTEDGARGFVHTASLANLWIRVSKSQQTIYVYRGTELVKQYPADLGYNSFADKERRGNARDRDNWRTPEGVFAIVSKNPRSQYYKALVLNYPTAEDAERGLKSGIISQSEYAAIVRADANSTMPPMNTALGGMIEIHGRGTGARSNWTHGCIAVHDNHMDEIYNLAHLGTPVLVEQ